MGGWKYSPKTGGFQLKREGWNLWHFSENDILHATQDRDCSSVDDDNDDYQWLPAEFRN